MLSDVIPGTGPLTGPSPVPLHAASSEQDRQWWRSSVIYQVYPRSFRDLSGDGIGDLPGITAELGSLAELDIDALWLSPFFKSPQNDAGYDVADYCSVDPLFGTLEDFDALVEKASGHGIRIIVDLVPNHCSNEHALFQAALAAPAGSPERDMFIFRDGAGSNGDAAPNNWQSHFGGSAWTRTTNADGTPASGTCTCSIRASRISTGTTPLSALNSNGCCASGWTAASAVSASMWPTPW